MRSHSAFSGILGQLFLDENDHEPGGPMIGQNPHIHCRQRQ